MPLKLDNQCRSTKSFLLTTTKAASLLKMTHSHIEELKERAYCKRSEGDLHYSVSFCTFASCKVFEVVGA